jgi:MFS family permease
MKRFINKITRTFIKDPVEKTKDVDMLRARRIIILLAVSVALIMTGFGIVMPVFARRLEDFGSGVTELGFTTIGFALAQFALAPVLGSLGDRIGRRPIILLALGGYAAVNIGFLFAPNTIMLTVLRCLEGAITAGLLPAAQATVGDIVPADRRAQGVGIVMAGYGFGFILGPFIGGLLYDMWGFAAPFIASFSMGMIAFIFARIMVPETRTSVKHSKNKGSSDRPERKVFSMDYLPRPLSSFTILILVSFVLTFAFAFISPVMVFYVYNELNFSATQFGLLIGVYGLAMVLGQIILGGISDKFGRKSIIILGLIISSVFYVGMMFLTNFVICAVVSAIGGIGNALATAASSAYILDITDESHRSRIMGIRGSLMALGEAIGPLLAIVVSNHSTPQSMFMISSLVGIAMAFTAMIVLQGTKRQDSAIKVTQSSDLVTEAIK